MCDVCEGGRWASAYFCWRKRGGRRLSAARGRKLETKKLTSLGVAACANAKISWCRFDRGASNPPPACGAEKLAACGAGSHQAGPAGGVGCAAPAGNACGALAIASCDATPSCDAACAASGPPRSSNTGSGVSKLTSRSPSSLSCDGDAVPLVSTIADSGDVGDTLARVPAITTRG